MDLVVAQVGAHLGRGHSLFAPVATTAGAGLEASADTYESVARRVGDRAQMLDAKGKFAQGFGDTAQRISSRWAATGGFDRLLAGNLADGAAADAAGRGQSGNVINGAVGDTARAQPYTNTAAGQQALVQALRDRLVDQQKVIEAYKQRSAVLAARVRQLGYGAGRQPGGGMGQMLQGLGSSMGRGGGSGGGMGSGMGMPNFGSILKPGNTNSSASAPGGNPIGNLRGGVLLGELTPNSTPEQVASAILHEAKRRGYSDQQGIAILSSAMQESGLRPGAVHPNGKWSGIFQQDTSYPGRANPNLNIAEFFNRLGRHGGPSSPDIWKSIFWLQQRPGEASADAAYANGRKEYMTEIKSQLGRATAMYRQLTAG
ncbi:hypothetical protein D2E64_22555 [Mycobacteroides abscessus]|nr:hypothetical protein [Mycobacteroides abscessus subsp. massiliense]PVA72326.1 hypothetical protein DDJ76_23250 [Mycobacteroides abscessus]RIT04150.1 hypothetical protein D2E64_22555 [Mycobacteroides abscessus]